MKFVALWSLKESVDQAKMAEIIGRRAGFEFSAGTSPIAEYWSPRSSPVVVSIFEADDAAAMMLNSVAWVDVFDVDVFPVVEWEEGLEKLSRLLGGK